MTEEEKALSERIKAEVLEERRKAEEEAAAEEKRKAPPMDPVREEIGRRIAKYKKPEGAAKDPFEAKISKYRKG